MPFIKNLESAVTSWTQVTVEPHRFGGREFQFSGKEFGHIHPNGMLDILFNKKLREILVQLRLAETHHLLPETGWISLYTKNQSSMTNNALILLWLSYALLNKRKQHNFDILNFLNQQPFVYPQELLNIL